MSSWDKRASGKRVRFPGLFQPGRLGSLKLKNRLVMPAMLTKYGSGDGFVTERLKNYYEARAKGGVGLVIIEAAYVHPSGQIRPNQLGIFDDKFVIGLKELSEVIRNHGAAAAIQLHHAGRLARSELTGVQPLGPSAIPMGHFAHGLQGELPKEMSASQIEMLTLCFAKAAERAKEAGIYGVEIHAASGYLFAQFLSRAANHRQDAYGGSLENRARFLMETLRAIRKATGTQYPIWCRINGKEHGIKQGISIDEAKETACMAEEAGADAIHVTATGPQSQITVGAQPLVPGLNMDLAYEIKKVVKIPVITVGWVTPQAGEEFLEAGKADYVAMGKALIADPDLPNKLAVGQVSDIRPCLVCMGCHFDPKPGGDPAMRCQVNASAGRECDAKIERAEIRKDVLVVGGGPAGMETARVAALRGHRVSLYERRKEAGGMLVEASVPPHKEKIRDFTRYLEGQIRNLKVKVKLGEELTLEAIEKMKPDAVVIATGAIPITPPIKMAKGAQVVTAIEVLRGEIHVGERVAVVGGGLVGCETAEYLAEKGRKVILLEMLDEIGADIGPVMGPVALMRLKDLGVRMEAGVKVIETGTEGVQAETKVGLRSYEADTVVLAVGMRPEKELACNLEGKVKELYRIGDCVAPRRIGEAILEGWQTGHRI